MTTSALSVQPYLFFNGRCEVALNFYRDAIGADTQIVMRFKDSPPPHQGAMANQGEKVMHATMTIGDTMLMASDGQCEDGAKFEGFSLAINVPDESEADRVFNALARGGQVHMPLAPTFWAPKFGMVADKFGVGWMVSVQHKPQ
jgi:PhnB protein